MTQMGDSKLVDMKLSEFFDAVAARISTPGGGAVAGAAGALGATLARMVAAYSMHKGKQTDQACTVWPIADRLRQLDEALRRSIDDDAEAYGAYVVVSKAKNDTPESREQLQQATRRSMGVPMDIAAKSNDVLDSLYELVERGNKWLLSDLEAAAILAEATVRCAGCSVRVNADQLADSAEANEARSRIDALEQSAQRQLSEILKALGERGKS
ncbi:MAG: sugar ABC transporter substrate-binding protein [Phycisphaerae bacterium]|nr:MAG: sugar ABC transporter substrate-binding protein [Phycisphaerae bacterium]